MSDIQNELQAPFESRDIEWRIGRSGQTKSKTFWATALAYLTNRAIMSRLDSVFGPAGWKNEFKEWRVGDKAGVLCGLSVKLDGEWVTKWDGAENTDIESVKGGLSDSMKRAAVQWGIGRYLYNLDEAFVETSEEKRKDWKYAKTKEGAVFYWKAPELPGWALPAIKSAVPRLTPEEAGVLTELVDGNDERFFAWADKAIKAAKLGAIEMRSIKDLPKSLYEKAKNVLEAEGNKVAV